MTANGWLQLAICLIVLFRDRSATAVVSQIFGMPHAPLPTQAN
jgi:hypothetical protein